MWLFCKNGFFSAVENSGNNGLIHLRARFRGDLERLFTAHGISADIKHTEFNDYAYRADITKDSWADIVKAEALDIDYTNFKAAVHDGTERDRAYIGAWCAMRDGQMRYNT